MQDRYTGDVGDYGKYGLLRKIYEESRGKIRLGINWFYVTREENDNVDGNHIGYLTKENKDQDRYRACFPDLYDKLGSIIHNHRAVSEIEKNQVLPKSTIFFSKPMPYNSTTASDRMKERELWLDESLSELEKADILFLDPDNGIQVDTSKKSYPNSIKYVYPDEIERYYRLGKSIIIYNHRDRRPRAEYNRKIHSNRHYVNSWDDIKVLRFKRVSVRDYIFLIQNRHRCLINKTIASLTREPHDFLFEKYQT